MTRAVVFAYHNVGVRCLATLLAHGLEVPLVVTQRDSPGETIWFSSVAGFAAERGLECAFPEDPNEPGFAARIAALAPDFLFSFYYRSILSPEILSLPRICAMNLHRSCMKFHALPPLFPCILPSFSR